MTIVAFGGKEAHLQEEGMNADLSIILLQDGFTPEKYIRRKEKFVEILKKRLKITSRK